ncbi:MAG: 30S ribosomal protein S2 [Bacteroidetes bacterium]|nr:30S ribosomal protein S2 [Bacteroidota bacterium]
MPKNRASIEELLKAGSHFGHLTSRWNPKMKPFIFMKRNGIHIINLNLTQKYLDEAGDAIARFARRGKRVLFTGTKKQAQDIIRKHAKECGSPYVVERWLGGTLTNFATIRKSIRRMEELVKMEEDGTLEQLKKKERLMKAREREKLEKVLTGIQDMARIPGAIFVVDIRREHIAVREAKKLGIPIIAIVDTNCDPDLVDYPIPANDDALKSVDLITGVIASAVAEGQKEREIQEAEAKAEKERLEQENAKARAAKKAAKAEEDQAAADKKGEETPDSDAKAGDEADTANGKAETAAPEAADSGDETDKVAAEARVEDGKSEVAQKTEAEKVQ